MKIATYYNKATNETYKLAGIQNVQQAYDVYEFVCRRNNWNPSMFTHDVSVKVS